MEQFLGKVTCIDCLVAMKQLPDKCIDLVLTDPPYGIDYGSQLKGKGLDGGGSDKNGWKSYGENNWDKERPSKEYFDEIFRISKNQIIWGGNYFSDYLKGSQGWLVWNKGQRGFSLADGELAFTSYDKALRIFDYARARQLNDENRQHPTQKPVALIDWCIKYAKLNNESVILDPFSGSGSVGVSCIKNKMKFIGFELEQKYVDIANKRIQDESRKLTLF